MKLKPAVFAALLLVCAISGSTVSHAKQVSASGNQIMFEGIGSGTFNSQQMQFGFSVRCYGASCVGAIAFGSASSVVYVTGTVTELQQASYMMSLSSAQGSSKTLPPSSTATISCSLANTPPATAGESNTVTMSCSTPAGSGVSTTATVVVPTN